MSKEPSGKLLPYSGVADTEIWRAIRALREERSALKARLRYLDGLKERLTDKDTR